MQKVEITVPSPVAMSKEGSGVAVPVVLRWTLLTPHCAMVSIFRSIVLLNCRLSAIVAVHLDSLPNISLCITLVHKLQ